MRSAFFLTIFLLSRWATRWSEKIEYVPKLLPYLNSSPLLSPKTGEAPPLPPAGPVWFPSVMGTGIVTALLMQNASRIPGGADLALIPFSAAWLLLVGLTASFILRCLRIPGTWTMSLTSPAIIPFWGTVSMGYLSVGSATAAVIPAYFPRYEAVAWYIVGFMWLVGVVIGVISALTFAYRMAHHSWGAPHFVWGLAVVGPMVASNAGAHLSVHLPIHWGAVTYVLSLGCFVITFSLAIPIFTRAYAHVWSVQPLALVAAASSWIPLGFVGQSTAAAQAFALYLPQFADGPLVDAFMLLALIYGWVMVAIGLPLAVWAAIVTLRAFRNRIPFTPGWWATTFPIGTMSLGASALAQASRHEWLFVVSAALTVVLCGTVTLSAVGSVRAVLSARHTP